MRIAAAAILGYVALCALLYLLQDRLIYHRVREVDRPGAQSLRIQSNDALVKVWVLHPGRRAAVIYFGGNADDVGASLADFSATFPERTVYLVNYRGYGGSTGRPSEVALIADAQLIYDHIAPRHERIIAMGRSLGTAVATALAASRPVERLILATPFDTLGNVAAEHFPIFPVHWLLRDQYNSAARIGSVRAPVLVLVAQHDRVISRARSDALIAAIPAPLRQVVVINGASHDDLQLFLAYLQQRPA